MKLNNFLLIVFIFTFLASCSNAENIMEKLIKSSNNKDMTLLLKYPHKISEAPSKRYVFVFATGVEPLENKRKLAENSLNIDYLIDGFKFNKGEYKWWFIFDFVEKKIIIKGSNLVLFDDKPEWKETDNILILMMATSRLRYLLFYKMNINNEPFIKEVFYVGKIPYIISSDSKYFIYRFINKVDDFSGIPIEIGIKIWDIEKSKDIAIITPSTEGGEIEIIKLESNKKLLYREINKGKVIDEEMSYIIKN